MNGIGSRLCSAVGLVVAVLTLCILVLESYLFYDLELIFRRLLIKTSSWMEAFKALLLQINGE
jgi:hypothetical protein